MTAWASVRAFFQPGKTSQSRGEWRLRRAGATAVATLIVRGFTVIATLVTIPFIAPYLGAERFGLWMTLGTVLAWLSLVDLGMANSLIHALAAAEGKDDQVQARRVVASAIWIMAGLGGLLIFSGLCLWPFVSWSSVFNVTSPQAVTEVRQAVLVVLVILALRLLSSLSLAIYQGLQEGWLFQIWSGLAGLLSIAALLTAISFKAGLPTLLLSFFGTQVIGDFMAAADLFLRRRKWLRPRRQDFDRRKAIWLLRSGTRFWVAQISAVLLLQTDLIIVTRLFGAGEAGSYGTALRLFTLIGLTQGAFIVPLQAAYSEAQARGDHNWITSTFRSSVLVSLLCVIPVAGLLCFFAPQIFRLLVTPELLPVRALVIALMCSEIINSVARCISILLNGLGHIRSQVVFGPVGGLVNIALSLLLARLVGVSGIAWATALCLLIFWVGIMGTDALWRLQEKS